MGYHSKVGKYADDASDYLDGHAPYGRAKSVESLDAYSGYADLYAIKPGGEDFDPNMMILNSGGKIVGEAHENWLTKDFQKFRSCPGCQREIPVRKFKAGQFCSVDCMNRVLRAGPGF